MTTDDLIAAMTAPLDPEPRLRCVGCGKDAGPRPRESLCCFAFCPDCARRVQASPVVTTSSSFLPEETP